jgi:hypothetical protein
VQPLKNYAMLRSNLGSSATRVELSGDTDWIVEGGTYSIGDNATAIGTVTIASKRLEYDANGQPFVVVETTAAFGSAITTANYAMLVEYAVGYEEVTADITTGQLFIDACNDSQYIGAHKHANFTNAAPDAVATLTPLKQIAAWGAPSVGTSPAANASGLSDFLAQLQSTSWEDFLLRYGAIPQAYLLVMGDATAHGYIRDYALTERARGYPISVTTGCRWGDVVVDAGDATDPGYRAGVLNSQDVALCAPGWDYEAAYLTLAPALFGRRVAAGPGHNLTNDELLFSTLEARWDEITAGELTTLLRSGVCTVKLSTARTIRYRIAEGINTLQSNAVLWNPGTKDTWSIQQRDLVDFCNRVMQVDLEEDIVGADGVNPSVIAATLRLRADKVLIPRGYMVDFTITSITLSDDGSGWVVASSARYPTPVDFILLENTLLIG